MLASARAIVSMTCDEFRRGRLAAAEPARHHHAEQPGLVQRRDDALVEPAPGLDAGRRLADQRRQLAGAGDVIRLDARLGGSEQLD